MKIAKKVHLEKAKKRTFPNLPRQLFNTEQ